MLFWSETLGSKQQRKGREKDTCLHPPFKILPSHHHLPRFDRFPPPSSSSLNFIPPGRRGEDRGYLKVFSTLDGFCGKEVIIGGEKGEKSIFFSSEEDLNKCFARGLFLKKVQPLLFGSAGIFSTLDFLLKFARSACAHARTHSRATKQ